MNDPTVEPIIILLVHPCFDIFEYASIALLLPPQMFGNQGSVHTQ